MWRESLSIGIIKESSVDYEFRTTVVSPLHRASDFEEIAETIPFARRYYLQNFVDSGDLVSGRGLTELGEDELAKALENTRVIIPQAKDPRRRIKEQLTCTRLSRGTARKLSLT